jgi:hypothetical protein
VYDESTGDYDLRIVPLADYFNHGSEYTEIDSRYDEYGNYHATSSYDVPAGSPLRVRYADPRNPSHLLARYGFLDETCPATYCKLLPPTVNRDMLDLGYSHDRMLFYRSGEVADEVSVCRGLLGMTRRAMYYGWGERALFHCARDVHPSRRHTYP